MNMSITEQNGWYELIDNPNLAQGDLFLGVYVPMWEIPTLQEEYKSIKANMEKTNLILLSQTCDLENNKLEMALLAPFDDLERIIDNNDKKLCENIRQKNLPGYFMLQECDIKNHELNLSIVSLRKLITLPMNYMHLLNDAHNHRLRLRDEYRRNLITTLERSFNREPEPEPIQRFYHSNL